MYNPQYLSLPSLLAKTRWYNGNRSPKSQTNWFASSCWNLVTPILRKVDSSPESAPDEEEEGDGLAGVVEISMVLS